MDCGLKIMKMLANPFYKLLGSAIHGSVPIVEHTLLVYKKFATIFIMAAFCTSFIAHYARRCADK